MAASIDISSLYTLLSLICHAVKVDVGAIEARHASQLAAVETGHASKLEALQEKLNAQEKDQEDAISRLKKEQEAERERVKRAIAELKKKADRQGLPFALQPMKHGHVNCKRVQRHELAMCYRQKYRSGLRSDNPCLCLHCKS